MFASQRFLRSALRGGLPAARRPQPPVQVARRNMGGGGHSPPATGWEGEVRKVLKEDWQVVCGIMGFYTTLYLLSKLFSGGKKKAVEPAAAGGGASTSNEIISMADDKFSDWYAQPGNAAKWESSLNDEKAYPA